MRRQQLPRTDLFHSVWNSYIITVECCYPAVPADNCSGADHPRTEGRMPHCAEMIVEELAHC